MNDNMGLKGGRPLLLALIAIAPACSHTRPASALREIAGESVVVTANNGERFDGYVLVYGARVAIRRTDDNQILPLEDIESIHDPRKLWGALQGLGIGVVVGGGVGALLGALAYEPCDRFCVTNPSRGEVAAVTGGVVGSITGLIGLVIGGVKGSPVSYSLYQSPTAAGSLKLGGPPGAAVGVTYAF